MNGQWRADKIYLYVAADGVARARCGLHVPVQGRLAPRQLLHTWLVGVRACVECAYETHLAVDGEVMVAQEGEHASGPVAVGMRRAA